MYTHIRIPRSERGSSGDPCEEVTRGGPAVGEVAAVQRRRLSPVRAGVSWFSPTGWPRELAGRVV
jgi:hypothetical protein